MTSTSHKTLLIPTDGSPCATRAVEQGVELAEQLDAEIHFLYVVDTNRGPESNWDIVVERQEAEGESALDEGTARAESRGLATTRHMRRGKPAEEIVAFAASNDVELVVMGTCGRSGIERILRPGSTAETVIKRCRVPVVVVPPAAEGDR